MSRQLLFLAVLLAVGCAAPPDEPLVAPDLAITGGRIKIPGRLGERWESRAAKWEKRLLDRMKADDPPVSITALVRGGQATADQPIVVALWDDRGEVAVHYDDRRRRVRVLDDGELASLAELLDGTDAPDQGPVAGEGVAIPRLHRVLHVNRRYGWRVDAASPPDGSPHRELVDALTAAADGANPGWSVALSFRNGDPQLVVDPGEYRLAGIRETESGLELLAWRPGASRLRWHTVGDGELGDATQEPDLPPGVRDSRGTAERLFWSTAYGIYHTQADGKGRRRSLARGAYGWLVVTPDSVWVVAAKHPSEDPHGRQVLTRIEVATGRERLVDLPLARTLVPVAWLPEWKRVLVFRHEKLDLASGFHDPLRLGRDIGSYYMVDPVRGDVLKVKGELRPWFAHRRRPLQPTRKAHHYWAALWDGQATQIGVFAARKRKFSAMFTVPQRLDSSRVWVEPEALVIVTPEHAIRLRR